MPKVSIIVPVYKVENYLKQCLRSIMNQTLKELEIIVVDEGDYDRCREIIDEMAEKDNRIIALHDKHGGYGNSVNAGIARASGEYIGIVESDDFIEPEMYELLYQKAKEMDADIVKSPFYYYFNYENEHIAPLMGELKQILPKDSTFTLTEYPVMLSTHPSIWAGIYKTDWLKNTGIQFLSKGAYLDIRFRFETLMAAQKIAWIDYTTYHWRLSNPNSTNAVWNIKAAIGRWEYLHEQFKGKSELWEQFAPYMLPEETLNIFNKYSFHKCTWQQRKKIKKYRTMYSDTLIEYSSYVSEEEKSLYLRGNLDYLALKRIVRKIYYWVKQDEFQRISIAVWIGSLIIQQFVPFITILFGSYWSFLLGIPVLKVLRKIYKNR